MVCVSVCLREIWHYRHQAGIRAIITVSGGQAREYLCGDFNKTTAFKIERSGRSQNMFLDPSHQLAVSMRIMRKFTDVCGESTDVSVTCQRAEALARSVFRD